MDYKIRSILKVVSVTVLVLAACSSASQAAPKGGGIPQGEPETAAETSGELNAVVTETLQTSKSEMVE